MDTGLKRPVQGGRAVKMSVLEPSFSVQLKRTSSGASTRRINKLAPPRASFSHFRPPSCSCGLKGWLSHNIECLHSKHLRPSSDNLWTLAIYQQNLSRPCLEICIPIWRWQWNALEMSEDSRQIGLLGFRNNQITIVKKLCRASNSGLLPFRVTTPWQPGPNFTPIEDVSAGL